MQGIIRTALFGIALALLSGCSFSPAGSAPPIIVLDLKATSPDLSSNSMSNDVYCEAMGGTSEARPPYFSWQDVKPEINSFVAIFEIADVNTNWSEDKHLPAGCKNLPCTLWTILNIPKSVRTIDSIDPTGRVTMPGISSLIKRGKNYPTNHIGSGGTETTTPPDSFSHIRYVPPCPAPGQKITYRLWVFGVSTSFIGLDHYLPSSSKSFITEEGSAIVDRVFIESTLQR